ncbi:MAG TPA: LuxR family transcriptional regulator [Nitrospira sp.]|nr:LuxR family transcriptional regulator [Nitrospira sp.]
MVNTSTKQPFPRTAFDALSKSGCRNFLEVLHYAMQAETPEQVRDVLVLFQNHFSFTRALGGLARLGPNQTFAGFSHVVNASYPDEWLYLYWKNGFADVDPVFKSALKSPGTQHWREIYRHMSSEKEHEFLATARQFGLCDGITTGSVDPACGVATFCSFASEQALDAKQMVPLVEYAGYYIHMALLRAAPKSAPQTARCVKELSAREVTILNWMKNGKTNWEIGKILGVSERTIRFHIESIFSKLEVTSRSQAVATAIEHGLPALHGLPTAS